ncbi:hypothetical protein AGR7B_Cc10401 [Agrobacterium deltaense RV3]|nr:hypothetical protein AGR7B_Cc10401 [Agrobacterium deltaense RV3]
MDGSIVLKDGLLL